MKVLHIFNEINFSGAEIMYANAAHIFQKNKFELVALNTGNKPGNFIDVFEKNHIRVIHFPVKVGLQSPLKYLKRAFQLFSLLKEEKIDIVHIHRSDIYLIGFLARIHNIRVVKTMHNVFKSRFFTYPYHFSQRFFARNISKVIFQTIGPSVYKHELSYYHNRTIQINNWFDDSRFFPAKSLDEKLNQRRLLGINDDSLVIVSVGGCSLIKRHEHILKAVNLIKDETDIEYLHLGTGSIEKEERQLAELLDIALKVHFLGNKQSIREYLIAADIFVMTSKFEGLGNVVLEAMACKIPCILYDVPGLRDLIVDNNGLLIVEDFKILADAILFLKQHPKKVETYIQNAYDYVNSEFSMRKSVEQIIEIYHNGLLSKT